MKICLINNLLEPYVRGGAEKVLMNYSQNFEKAGHKVFFISTKPGNCNKVNNKEKMYYLKSQYYDLKNVNKVFRVFWHIFNIFNFISYFHLKKIFKKEKPDLVMTHNLMGIGYLSTVLFRQLRINHVHVLHDIQLIHPSGLIYVGKEDIVNGVFAKIYQKINILLFSSPKVIISPSKWLLDKHLNKGFFSKSKTKVVRNPIRFNIGIKQIERKKNRILYIGQIEKHKGVFNLVKAFSLIEDKNLELIIAGDGTKKEILVELIKKDNRITYLGKVNSKKARELMQSSAFLVVPSICYENSPSVIYEAYHVKLPVIASNKGGISELISSEFLFEPNDIKEISNKVKKVLSMTNIDLGSNFKLYKKEFLISSDFFKKYIIM